MIYTIIILLLVVVVGFVVQRGLQHRTQKKQYYPESTQLYIGNLSYSANSHHLREFFSRYGEIDNVRLIKNSHTGRSKGFAFVTFFDLQDAKKALEANGKDLRGRTLVVRMAKPRDD